MGVVCLVVEAQQVTEAVGEGGVQLLVEGGRGGGAGAGGVQPLVEGGGAGGVRLLVEGGGGGGGAGGGTLALDVGQREVEVAEIADGVRVSRGGLQQHRKGVVYQETTRSKVVGKFFQTRTESGR